METYTQIKNYEGLYEVSDMGNVRSIKREILDSQGIRKRSTGGKVMKFYKMPNGYLHVALTKNGVCKSLRVHRLVAEAFIDNPYDLPEVNHLDGNKKNNIKTNLEWSNRSSNMIHALRNRLTSALGETHYKAKLTESQVLEIRKRYSEGEKQITLANEFGISYKTIHQIVKNKIWKSILPSS